MNSVLLSGNSLISELGLGWTFLLIFWGRGCGRDSQLSLPEAEPQRPGQGLG